MAVTAPEIATEMAEPVEFVFNRVESKVDPVTGDCTGFVVGLTAKCGGIVEYIDKEVVFDQPCPTFTDKNTIRNLCVDVAQENDWYNLLIGKLASRRTTPITGSYFSI